MGTPSIVYNKDCMEVMRSFPDNPSLTPILEAGAAAFPP